MATRRRRRPDRAKGQVVTFGGRAWRAMRDRVLARDGYVCQWCLREGYVVRATTADHIIPRKHGGANTEANLIAACARCNSSRGDSLGPPTWRHTARHARPANSDRFDNRTVTRWL